jgi:hypothetical protein
MSSLDESRLIAKTFNNILRFDGETITFEELVTDLMFTARDADYELNIVPRDWWDFSYDEMLVARELYVISKRD